MMYEISSGLNRVTFLLWLAGVIVCTGKVIFRILLKLFTFIGARESQCTVNLRVFMNSK